MRRTQVSSLDVPSSGDGCKVFCSPSVPMSDTTDKPRNGRARTDRWGGNTGVTTYYDRGKDRLPDSRRDTVTRRTHLEIDIGGITSPTRVFTRI